MNAHIIISELAAHYPRLWGLVESVAESKTERTYPAMLGIVSFCNEFDRWVLTISNQVSETLKKPAPEKISENMFGPNPLITETLEWLGDNYPEYEKRLPEISELVTDGLDLWRVAILAKTNTEELPHYTASVKCPACKRNSVMRYKANRFCVNPDCGFAWDK